MHMLGTARLGPVLVQQRKPHNCSVQCVKVVSLYSWYLVSLYSWYLVSLYSWYLVSLYSWYLVPSIR